MKVVGYMRVNSIEQLGGTQVAEKERSMVERYWIRKGLDMPIFIQVMEEIDRSFLFPQHRRIWRISLAVIFMMQRR